MLAGVHAAAFRLGWERRVRHGANGRGQSDPGGAECERRPEPVVIRGAWPDGAGHPGGRSDGAREGMPCLPLGPCGTDVRAPVLCDRPDAHRHAAGARCSRRGGGMVTRTEGAIGWAAPRPLNTSSPLQRVVWVLDGGA